MNKGVTDVLSEGVVLKRAWDEERASMFSSRKLAVEGKKSWT